VADERLREGQQDAVEEQRVLPLVEALPLEAVHEGKALHGQQPLVLAEIARNYQEAVRYYR
jgi:hypothetical protein